MGIFKMIWAKMPKKSSNHLGFRNWIQIVDNVDNVDYFIKNL